MPKYFVIPETQDGCSFPTQPDPVELGEVSGHIAAYLKRFEHQGYFSNCRQKRIPLNQLGFKLEPEDPHGGFFCIAVGGDR